MDIETHTPVSERASLIVNMRIQRDWGEMIMLCKGLQGIGIDNVAYVITLMEIEKISDNSWQNHVRRAAEAHSPSQSQRTETPFHYHLKSGRISRHLSLWDGVRVGYVHIPNIKTLYQSLTFNAAKCAFSVLLLLKLARLVPSSTNMRALISDAKTLLTELSKARASNNIYFRILGLTVEKCERALKEAEGETQDTLRFPDAEMDFQSYVPKEFILEWNFPGLTFCWMPFDFQDMFMDFGTGF